jgi:hypothetical protein
LNSHGHEGRMAAFNKILETPTPFDTMIQLQLREFLKQKDMKRRWSMS